MKQLTSQMQYFVSEYGVMSNIYRREHSGRIINTGYRAEVVQARNAAGGLNWAEHASMEMNEAAEAHLRRLFPGSYVAMIDGAQVGGKTGMPGIGGNSNVYITLGGKIGFTAIWLLLSPSTHKPGAWGVTRQDVEFHLEQNRVTNEAIDAPDPDQSTFESVR